MNRYKCENLQIDRRTKWWKRGAHEEKKNNERTNEKTKDLKVWIAYYR